MSKKEKRMSQKELEAMLAKVLEENDSLRHRLAEAGEDVPELDDERMKGVSTRPMLNE